jgi:hypothetical protein
LQFHNAKIIFVFTFSQGLNIEGILKDS